MTAAVLEVIRVRTGAGAAILDAVAPGWLDCVDTAELDVSDPDRCVLARVYGSYEDGMRALDLTPERAEALGFTVMLGSLHLHGSASAYFAALTAAWREIVSADE